MTPFFISIPHAGEQIPEETPWLQGLDEPLIMYDVDRYVHLLYQPIIKKLAIPCVISPWHRYAVDLNRWPDDIDAESVEGAKFPPGKFSQGLHWVKTTAGVVLMKEPIPAEMHLTLVKKYFLPFHEEIKKVYKHLRDQGHQEVFHLDAHSMPSKGTGTHRDKDQQRDQIVVSDFNGQSCKSEFRDLVVESYRQAGFSVTLNWPYIGGRLTQTYGRPQEHQHVVQVELNRALYMNEVTKKTQPNDFENVQRMLAQAIESIVAQIGPISKTSRMKTKVMKTEIK